MVTTKQQIEIEGFAVIFLAATISVFFVFNNSKTPQVRIITPLPASPAEKVSTPVPTPIVEKTMQLSPDGTKNIVLKTTHNTNGTQIFDISVANGAGEKGIPIYSETLSGTDKITIPFNTWSPDNKYFFIKKNNDTVYIFKASGEQFANNEKYLDLVDLFKKRITGNNYADATGWASETLIIVNTTKDDGTKGPSYWFEVPTKAIIPLATEF